MHTDIKGDITADDKWQVHLSADRKRGKRHKLQGKKSKIKEKRREKRKGKEITDKDTSFGQVEVADGRR